MSKFIPNSFQIPNAFVDEYLDRLSGKAIKCYLLIARKTTGWQKVFDRISTPQFMEKCGIKDRKTAFAAIEELEAVKLINVERKQGEINTFSLNFFIDENDDFEPVPKNGTSTNFPPEPVPKNGTGTSTKNWYSTKDNINIKNKFTNVNLQKKSKNPTALSDFEVCFSQFWQAGLPKVNKSKALKNFKSSFEKVCSQQPMSLEAFTAMLVNDVKTRLGLRQFGFDRLHPATYLNNQRWLDEQSPPDEPSAVFPAGNLTGSRFPDDGSWSIGRVLNVDPDLIPEVLR